MTDKVQKIREEIVGIINSINLFTPDEDGKNSSYEAGKLDIASKILQIIDSMQEEPVSEDLEEAARKYFKQLNDTCFIDSDIIRTFKAGANWQKQQMMKEAVSGHVGQTINGMLRALSDEIFGDMGFTAGDKVKLIIIKED